MPKLTLENIDLAEQFANLPVSEDYDESSAGISNKNFLPSYVVVDTQDCESLGNPKETIKQKTPKECKDVAKDGFRFVQFIISKLVTKIFSEIRKNMLDVIKTFNSSEGFYFCKFVTLFAVIESYHSTYFQGSQGD